MTDSQGRHHSDRDHEEIDLLEIFRIVWQGKWLITAITFVAAVIGLIVALLLPNVYRAEVLLAPNESQSTDGLAALATQYGGLASLAGINLDSGAIDKATIGLEILRSRKFVSDFIERHDLLVPLLAARGWDTDSGELEIDANDYDVASKKWVRDVSPPKKVIPSMQEAHDEFLNIMSVKQDKKSGFITLSVEHYSPTVSKQWVDWLVQDINSTIMLQDVAEAEQAIAYLRDQIESTSVADLRAVFSRLVEEQTKTVMLAKISPEYVFRTVDPAVVPEFKAKPNRMLIILFATALGGFAAAFLVVVKSGVSVKRH